jgi:serine/threonine protein kinase
MLQFNSRRGALGTGAFGSVHAGKLGDRDIAVKRFLEKKSYAWHQAAVREVVALCCIPPHPFVVQMFRAYVESRRVHIVMPRLKDTLHIFMKNNNASQSDCLRWGRQITQGLAHIHTHGFIHRDMKLENVLLDYDNNAIICDLGMARHKPEQDTHMTGNVCSLWTRAPELAGCENISYGVSIDAWSLGIILLSIAAGRYVFRTTPEKTILEKVFDLLGTAETQLPRETRKFRLQQFSADMPPEYFDAVVDLLDVNPSTRLLVQDLAKMPFWTIEGQKKESPPECEGAIVPNLSATFTLQPIQDDVVAWMKDTLSNLKRSPGTFHIANEMYKRVGHGLLYGAACCSLACKLNEVTHISSQTWAKASSEKVKDIYDAEEYIMVTLKGRLIL